MTIPNGRPAQRMICGAGIRPGTRACVKNTGRNKMSRRALHTEAPSGCILCLGDINFVLLALRLCLIGPGIDAAEFVDVGCSPVRTAWRMRSCCGFRCGSRPARWNPFRELPQRQYPRRWYPPAAERPRGGCGRLGSGYSSCSRTSRTITFWVSIISLAASWVICSLGAVCGISAASGQQQKAERRVKIAIRFI